MSVNYDPCLQQSSLACPLRCTLLFAVKSRFILFHLPFRSYLHPLFFPQQKTNQLRRPTLLRAGTLHRHPTPEHEGCTDYTYRFSTHRFPCSFVSLRQLQIALASTQASLSFFIKDHIFRSHHTEHRIPQSNPRACSGQHLAASLFRPRQLTSPLGPSISAAANFPLPSKFSSSSSPLTYCAKHVDCRCLLSFSIVPASSSTFHPSPFHLGQVDLEGQLLLNFI